MSVNTNFIGVDEDAYGDGDGATQPIDAWLQRRLQYNLQQCMSIGSPFTFTPVISGADDFTSFVGQRPYAALDGHTVWDGVLPVLKDQRGFEFTLLYQSQLPGSTYTGTKNQVLIRVGDSDSDWTDLTLTYSASVQTGHQTIAVTFPEKSNKDYLETCTIKVRSAVAASQPTVIGQGVNGQTTTIINVPPFVMRETDATGAKFWTPNDDPGGAAAPSADSRECMFFQANTTVYSNTAAPLYYDILQTEDVGADGSRAVMLQQVQAPLTLDESNPSGGTAYLHCCFFLRSLAVRPFMGSQAFNYAESAIINPAELAPNIDFVFGPSTEQVSLIHRAYLQPIVAATGPRGLKKNASVTETDGDVFASYDYAYHWPYVFGDYDEGVTSGQENTMVNDAFYCTTENPQLELYCTWLAVQHGAPYNKIVTVAPTPGKALDKFEKRGVGSEIEGATGSSVWDMSVAIEQMGTVVAGSADWDTDATSYGGFTDKATGITVWGSPGAAFSPELPPVLRGSYAEANGPKAGGDAKGFWFKEGSLFQEDFALLTNTKHIIDTSGMTATVVDLAPFRLKIDMVLNSFDGPLRDDEADLTDKLQLYLVSYTLLERPQAP